jgi:hypothetical protein
MARLRHAENSEKCLFIGVDRKSSADSRNVAFDPRPTFDWPRRRLNLDLVEEVTVYRHSACAGGDNVN